MANRHLIRALAIVCATLVATPLLAQIPRTISFQGVLADPQGILLPDGTYSLTLAIYDVPTGGTAIFSESQQVQVNRGVFNAMIGSTAPTGIPESISFDAPRWLGIQVSNGAELAPRTPLSSAPYALNASRAAFATSADTATHAAHAASADDAAHADTAHALAGGYVASVNGRQGSLEIVGAGATTVAVNGSQVVIRSTDQTGGVQRVENTDGSIYADPPQGPFVTLSIRSGGVQSHHLTDASVTTAKLAGGAVNASKVSTGGAAAGTALMSTGVATPVWQHPIAANLPFSGTGSSSIPLWALTNNGSGWAAAFTGASSGVQVSGGAIGLQMINGRLIASSSVVAGATSAGAASVIGGTSVVVEVTNNGAAGVPAYTRLPLSVENGTVMMVGTSDPDGASIDGFVVGANQFATFVRIGGSWKVQL